MSQDRSKSNRDFIAKAFEKALHDMVELPRDIMERILPSTAQIAEDALREAGQDRSLFPKLLKEKLEKCCKSALGPQAGRELAGKLWTAIADAIKTRQQQQQHLQQQQQHLQQQQQQQQQQHQHLQQQQHQPPVFSPYQQQQSSQQQPPQLQMPFTGQQQFAGQQQYHSASNPGNYNGMPHAMAQQPPQQHNIQMQHASAPMMPNHGAYQQSSQAPNSTVAPGFQMYHNQHYGGQNFHNMNQNANGNGSIGFMNNAGSSYPNGGVVNGYINPAAQPPPAVPHAPPMSGANQQGGSSLPAFPPMQHLNPPPSMSVPQPVQADSSGAAPNAPAAKQTKPRQPRKSKAEKEKEAAAKAAGTTMATPASESDALAAGEGATAAMAVDESSAVDVSPPAPTIPPEDDDGTERPIYSDREFNLTDGRVVQASEFDADRIMSEEDIARQLARRQLSERIYDESVAPSEPTRLHLVNMFDVECVLQKVNQRLGSHMTMSDGARRLLSAAIQQHLCTTVESSIVGARSRYQFSASRHYSSLKDHFAQGESVTTEQLGDFAFRFGPDVRTVLVNEHKKAEYLVHKFNEADRFKLIEDMKDHMSRVAFSGGKRRAENLDMSWKQAEDALAREGRLTMEQLAAFQFKLQTFQPYVRDVTSLKAVTNDGSEVPPVSLLTDVPPLDQHKNQEVLVQAKDFYKVLRDVRGMQGEKIVSRSFARRHGL